MSVACSVRRGRRHLWPLEHITSWRRAPARWEHLRWGHWLGHWDPKSFVLFHSNIPQKREKDRMKRNVLLLRFFMLIVSKICYLSGGSLQTKVTVGIIENSVLSHLKGSRLEWKHVNDSDLYGELWETQWRWGWFCNRVDSVHQLQNVWHKQAVTCETEKSHRSSALCPAEVQTSTQPLAFTRASIYCCLPPRGTLPPGWDIQLMHTLEEEITILKKSKASLASNEPTSMWL